MHNFVKKLSLVLFGVIAGVMISLNFSAVADKTLKAELPPSPDRRATRVYTGIWSN